MPTFEGGLQAISSQNAGHKNLIGRLYRYFIADPSAIQGPVSYEAFFYPDDRLTIIGQQLATAIHYSAMTSGNVVCFELQSQNPQQPDQIRVVVDYDDIRVNSRAPGYFLKIGADAVLQVLTVTNWASPRTYTSAPPMLELTCSRYLQTQSANCY